MTAAGEERPVLARRTSARLAAWVVGAALATGALGRGGRDASALLLNQSGLLLATLVLVLGDPGSLFRRRRGLALAAAFALFAYVRAPYRYAALLDLTDIGAAVLVFALAAVAGERCSGRDVIEWGLVAGACTTALAGFGESLAGADVHGFFANPHHSASLAAAAGVLLLARGTDVARPRGERLAALALSGVFAMYVVLLASRGGALAFGAGAMTLVVLRGRARLALAIVLALALVTLLPTPLGKRVRAGASSDDPYAFQRPRIWAASLRMSRDYLLRGGVGLGSFEKAVRRYNFPVETGLGRYGRLPNLAHNEYLELLAVASVPGLLLLLVPVGKAGLRARRLLGGGPEGRALVSEVVPPLAALLTHAFVEALFHSPANLQALAALLGLLAGADEARLDARTEVLGRERRLLVVIAVAALWAQTVLVPWAGDRLFLRFQQTADPRALDLAIELVPGSASYRSVKGGLLHYAFLQSGDIERLDAARHAIEAAIALDPIQPRHRATLAAIFHQAVTGAFPAQDLAEQALARYAEAIRLDPFDPFIRLDRVNLLGALGRPAEAAGEAETLLAIEPASRGAWEALAQARRQLGDVRGAAIADLKAAELDAQRRSRRGLSEYDRNLLVPAMGW